MTLCLSEATHVDYVKATIRKLSHGSESNTEPFYEIEIPLFASLLCFKPNVLLGLQCSTCYASTYLFCACAVVGVNRAILVTCRDRQINRNLVASLNGSNFIILAKVRTYLARNERNSIKFELLLGCKRHLDKILQPHHIKYLNIILILSIILCTNMYSLA